MCETNLPLGFITVILNLIMIEFNWINFNRLSKGEVQDNELELLEKSSFLRFYLIITILVVLGLICRICTYVYEKFRGAYYENIIDLCSIGNISIMIFLRPDRVCYVHGKNVFNTGEGTLELIYKKMELE